MLSSAQSSEDKMDSNSKASRKIAIADHIWEAFEDMAQQMGTDRDGLVNQAMFMFARLNGFMDGSRNGSGKAASAPISRAASASSMPRAESSMGNSMGHSRASAVSQPKLDDDPVRREVAERVLETAAELERLIKGKNEKQDEEDNDSGRLEDEEPLQNGNGEEEAAGGGQLYLMAEGGELDKIAKDRFVIGRGKHCDFVINSGKVSREHAVIIRESEEYFIEDLGSSNGTWFNKQRIKRRKIEDGDEYYICSEKIKLVMR
jgi:hypothetical protein